MAEIKFSTGQGNNMNIDGKKASRMGGVIVGLIVLLIVVFNCFTIVEEGHRGVRLRFGAIVSDNLSPGLNFKIPFIEEIRAVDIRNQVFPWAGDAYTKDTQTVNDLRLKVTYQYDTAMLSHLIRNVGIDNVEARFLFPNVQKIAKDEIGRVDAEMLVQTRSTVQDLIQDELTRVLAPHGILVTEFAIENIAFNPAFEAAIESKVIAAQDVQRMRHRTDERRVEAEQIEITARAQAEKIRTEAEAEAEAIKLIQAQLVESPAYIDYLKIIQWNGTLPQVIGDGVNPFVVLGSENYNAPQSRPAQAQQTQVAQGE